MARTLTWRVGPGIQGNTGIQASGWIANLTPVTIPNNHTIIRVITWGALAVSGTRVDNPVSTQIPPHLFYSSITFGTTNRLLHEWAVPSKVAIAQIYDTFTAQRVAYWDVTSESLYANFEPNWKAAATGTQQIRWNLSAQGANISALGNYYGLLGSRILTMSP